MGSHSRIGIAACAALASVSLAQQPPAQVAPADPPAQAAPAGPPTAPPVEGFFRPTDDPVLTRFPTSAEVQASLTQAAAAEAVEAERRAREAAERELDRAQREHERAQAAAPATRPMIVSPLSGTAPIVSALDGTAPIVSPIGR